MNDKELKLGMVIGLSPTPSTGDQGLIYQALLNNDLISANGQGLIVTPRGKAWLQMIADLPLPTPAGGFTNPQTGELIVVTEELPK